MAKLYVTEFGPTNTPFSPDRLAAPPLVDQTPVTFTTTTQSAAFSGGTALVRIQPDGICSIAFGTNPTATTNNMRLTAGQTEYFSVPMGQSYKVAAVTNT